MTNTTKNQTDLLAELDQRVADMYASDLATGENKNASPMDYVRWAIEEIEANH
jgi:hypothetical protein